MDGKQLTHALIAGAACWTGTVLGDEFVPPVKLKAGGNPIDVQRTAHAAPFVGDFDGDGVRDLLVGEFHQGRLRVFRNSGTDQAPRFGEYEWFQVAGELGRVPEG